MFSVTCKKIHENYVMSWIRTIIRVAIKDDWIKVII